MLFIHFYSLLVLVDMLHVGAECPITYATCPMSVSTLYVVNDTVITENLLVTLQTLGGTLAKSISPMIYRVGDPTSSYTTWLDDIESSTEVVVNYEYAHDAPGLIEYLITSYDIIVGVATYSEVGDISLSMAVSYCAGSSGVIAVSEAEASQYITKYNLMILYDATSQPLPDTLQFSQHTITFQQPSAQLYMIEYSVFAAAPFMGWDDARRDTALANLQQHSNGCACAFGWVGDEGEYVSHLAKYGVFVHASDWAKNIAPLSNVEVSKAPRTRSSRQLLVQPSGGQDVHTVTFVMTDGDNLQWLLGSFLDESWFGAPALATTPASFTLSPALVQVAPITLSHLQQSVVQMYAASFVAAPSGLGYTYPELLTDEERKIFAAETSVNMQDAGMEILNILAGGDDITNETLLRSSSPFLAHDNIGCVFYYTYGSGYAGGGGKTIFSENGKPIITARFSLWGDNDDPALSPMLSNDAMIEVLRQQVRDISSVDGYSVIPVHAWSHTIADVQYIMENVGAGVQLLDSYSFIEKFKTNVKP